MLVQTSDVSMTFVNIRALRVYFQHFLGIRHPSHSDTLLRARWGHWLHYVTTEEQLKTARGSIWARGIHDYTRYLDEWKEGGGLNGYE